MTRDRQDFATIERGRYLAIVGDCAACHTDAGGKPYAGGRAIETPFGNLLASNLTPDHETGIGAWSDDDFVSAVQRGRSRGGVRLYPAMPYPYYTKMRRADVLAIRAYLGTLEPVRHQVIANQLPFPFRIRASMAVWNALFFTPGTFKPVPGKSEEWNAGAYLVEGPAHCGACHTAKNFLGVVLQGARSAATASAPTGPAMPAFDWKLSDAQVAAVLTYIRNSWGNAAAAVSAAKVRRSRDKLAQTVE